MEEGNNIRIGKKGEKLYTTHEVKLENPKRLKGMLLLLVPLIVFFLIVSIMVAIEGGGEKFLLSF